MVLVRCFVSYSTTLTATWLTSKCISLAFACPYVDVALVSCRRRARVAENQRKVRWDDTCFEVSHPVHDGDRWPPRAGFAARTPKECPLAVKV